MKWTTSNISLFSYYVYDVEVISWLGVNLIFSSEIFQRDIWG